MTKTLITHPDNVPILKQAAHKWLAGHFPKDELSWGWPPFLNVKTNKYMDRYGPAKRVRLPNGTAIDRESFVMRCGPVTYGPEDLKWLMWAGVIQEQLEPVFYIVDEPEIFRVFQNFGSFMPDTRRVLISNVTW